MEGGECVTELVAWTCIDRPFLGERVNPILAIPQTLKILNVLHDSECLIVGFLDQEAVVLNWRRVVAQSCGCCRARRSVCLRLFFVCALSGIVTLQN